MAVGSLKSTPPSRATARNFFNKEMPMNVRRPNRKRRTGRRPSDGRDKAFAKTCRVNTTSACGTTTTTNVWPSARDATSAGVRTVVLPDPMIICRREDFLFDASVHKVRDV